jgi:hypothetical protein
MTAGRLAERARLSPGAMTARSIASSERSSRAGPAIPRIAVASSLR